MYISYNTLIDTKPLHIMFDKEDGFIRVYYGTRSLALFGPKKDDAIYSRIRYLISQKSGITYVFNHLIFNHVFNQKSKVIHLIIYL